MDEGHFQTRSCKERPAPVTPMGLDRLPLCKSLISKSSSALTVEQAAHIVADLKHSREDLADLDKDTPLDNDMKEGAHDAPPVEEESEKDDAVEEQGEEDASDEESEENSDAAVEQPTTPSDEMVLDVTSDAENISVLERMIESNTLKSLRDKCRSKHLSAAGTKRDLAERIVHADDVVSIEIVSG